MTSLCVYKQEANSTARKKMATLVILLCMLIPLSQSMPTGCTLLRDFELLDCFTPGTKDLNDGEVHPNVKRITGRDWRKPFSIPMRYFPNLQTMELTASSLRCEDIEEKDHITVIINGETCVDKQSISRQQTPKPEEHTKDKTSSNPDTSKSDVEIETNQPIPQPSDHKLVVK